MAKWTKQSENCGKWKEERNLKKKAEKAVCVCVYELEWAFSITFWSMQSGVDSGSKGQNRDNPSHRQSAQSEQEKKKKATEKKLPHMSLNTCKLQADLNMLNLSQLRRDGECLLVTLHEEVSPFLLEDINIKAISWITSDDLKCTNNFLLSQHIIGTVVHINCSIQ